LIVDCHVVATVSVKQVLLPLLLPLPCGFLLYQVWSLALLTMWLQTTALFLQPLSPLVDCCCCWLIVIFSLNLCSWQLQIYELVQLLFIFSYFFFCCFVLPVG